MYMRACVVVCVIVCIVEQLFKRVDRNSFPTLPYPPLPYLILEQQRLKIQDQVVHGLDVRSWLISSRGDHQASVNKQFQYLAVS